MTFPGSAAYRLGAKHAWAKFAGASAPPANDGASSRRDSGSPVATVSPKGREQAISQGFRYNASLGPTSGMSDPGYFNNSIRGGPPTSHELWDTTGGLE